MRNGLFIATATAMLLVTFAPRSRVTRAMPIAVASPSSSAWHVQLAWLAERESAQGDWESVSPPLREGDELQLTVVASEDACVYVLDSAGHILFPPLGAPSSLSQIRANWPYAIPGPHRTWRLDGAAHDDFYLVASRHPLANPAAELGHGQIPQQPLSSITLPLRDGRPGVVESYSVSGDGVIFDRYDAR